MKRILPLLMGMLLVLCGACGGAGDKARLSGKFENIGNEVCYLYSEEGSIAGIDTIQMEAGRFVADYAVKEPTLVTLLFPNFSKRYVILEQGEEVTITGDAASLAQAEIVGTEANETLTTFRHENLHRTEAEQRLAATKFIQDHPASLASLALFRTYFVDRRGGDPATTRQLLATMGKHLGTNSAYRATASLMEREGRTAVGATLPRFTAKTLDGRTVSERDFAGRPLIILCTAAWNPDTRAYHQRMRQLQRTMSQRVQFLLVSFDLNKEALTAALHRDSISAPVLYDGQGLFSPLHDAFGLRIVPTVFLVNSHGVIVAREVREDKLEAEAAKLK